MDGGSSWISAGSGGVLVAAVSVALSRTLVARLSWLFERRSLMDLEVVWLEN